MKSLRELRDAAARAWPGRGSTLWEESQHGLGWKGPFKAILSQPLPQAGTSSTGSGCSEPCPTWPGTLPGTGHRPPLWAVSASVSPPSAKIFSSLYPV